LHHHDEGTYPSHEPCRSTSHLHIHLHLNVSTYLYHKPNHSPKNPSRLSHHSKLSTLDHNVSLTSIGLYRRHSILPLLDPTIV
jgi:hypothetical protein